MRIINIDVYFENELLHIRFDIIEGNLFSDDIFKDHYFSLGQLESYGIKNSIYNRGLKEKGEFYQNTLKYVMALTRESLGLPLAQINEERFSVFDVSRASRKLMLTVRDKQEEHQHHEVIFTLPPNFNVFVSLLACLSIYFNAYFLNDLEFENHITFNEKLNKNRFVPKRNPEKKLNAISICMQNILSLKNSPEAYAYKKVMGSLEEMAIEYAEKRKQKENNFTFLDFMNYECEYHSLHGKFSTLVQLYFSENLENNLEKLLHQTRQLLASLSEQQAYIMCVLFDFHRTSKKNLMASILNTVVRKPANDGGLFKQGYTEIRVLEEAEFTLGADGKIRIRDIQNNRGYIDNYTTRGTRASEDFDKPDIPHANPLEFENEIKCLGSYLGWEIEADCDVHQEIVFKQKNTPLFMQQGFINVDLFKTLFYAFYRGDFLVQLYLAAQTQEEDILFKRLPKELLLAIVVNSDTRFRNLPWNILKKAVSLGIEDGVLCYGERRKYQSITSVEGEDSNRKICEVQAVNQNKKFSEIAIHGLNNKKSVIDHQQLKEYLDNLAEDLDATEFTRRNFLFDEVVGDTTTSAALKKIMNNYRNINSKTDRLIENTFGEVSFLIKDLSSMMNWRRTQVSLDFYQRQKQAITEIPYTVERNAKHVKERMNFISFWDKNKKPDVFGRINDLLRNYVDDAAFHWRHQLDRATHICKKGLWGIKSKQNEQLFQELEGEKKRKGLNPQGTFSHLIEFIEDQMGRGVISSDKILDYQNQQKI